MKAIRKAAINWMVLISFFKEEGEGELREKNSA